MGELGLLPDQFWRLTYAEFAAMSKGFRRKQVHRANELLYLAWHTELFARQDRLPSLDSIMRDPDEVRTQAPQDDDAMLAMAKMLNAAFGGDVVEVYD